jgi:salicylate hydroxylase
MMTRKLTFDPRKIAIIGGGIGGLAAALALLRRGIDVDVYEQSKDFREIGAGIEISPNGTRVLDALGLNKAFEHVRAELLKRELRHWKTGKTWNWFELGATSIERYGAHHMMLHRGDLHRILLEAVQNLKRDALKLDTKCVALTQSDQQVEIRFDTGQISNAAYVIGADGIHSKVRECLFGADKPEFTGCVAWRGLVSMEQLPTNTSRTVGTNWLGPKRSLFHYPIRCGELMNFTGIVERDDWQIESWRVEGTTDELANDFRGWHRDVQVLIQNVGSPFKWALMARRPLDRWSKGRITLLGDACHPTLPFLGQGAVMAIEDAYVVAACLEKYFEFPTSVFERYEGVRRTRTASVVQKSHENRKQTFSAALAEESEIAASVKSEWQQVRANERLDWLYKYDVTAARV